MLPADRVGPHSVPAPRAADLAPSLACPLPARPRAQAQLRAARAQIGAKHPPAACPPDISRAGLEYARLELERLRADKARVVARARLRGQAGRRFLTSAPAERSFPASRAGSRQPPATSTLQHTPRPGVRARRWPRRLHPAPLHPCHRSAPQARREERVAELARAARTLAAELGEDAEAALADAHPSLAACMWCDAGCPGPPARLQEGSHALACCMCAAPHQG